MKTTPCGKNTNSATQHPWSNWVSCPACIISSWLDFHVCWMADKMHILAALHKSQLLSGSTCTRRLYKSEFSCRKNMFFFPTCQVRVVRFYVSCFLLVLLLLVLLLLLLLLVLLVLLVLLLNCDPRRTVFSVGPQPRPSTHSVPCRTSTTTIHAQCSLPDLNHDHPRPVFPAGPQPRPSTPSVPCRTSTASIHAKCSLPDLM